MSLNVKVKAPLDEHEHEERRFGATGDQKKKKKKYYRDLRLTS